MTKSPLRRLLFFMAAYISVYCSSEAQTASLYVALNGNDAWSGSLAKPNDNGDDGPFLTIQRALLQVEDLNVTGLMPKQGAIVFVRGGIYTIEQSLILTRRLSPKNGAAVVFRNYPKEKATLVGGREIKGFQAVTDPNLLSRISPSFRDKIVAINLKSLSILNYGLIANRGRPGLELFFNNIKMTPARWPDTGWAKIEDVPQQGELIYKGELPHIRFGIPVGKHYGRFVYSGNRPSGWSDFGNIILHGYWVWDWYDEYLSIQSIDSSSKEIFIRPPHSHYGYCKDQRYYALNVLEELDRPGEWYIDRSAGNLLFWPPDSLQKSSAFVSLLDSAMMVLDNTANIRIEGLFLEYSRGSGIIIRGGRDNEIAGCSFSYLGDVAVRIDGGTHNGLTSCDIHDVAAGGVSLNGGDRLSLKAAGNFAVNNHIHHIGQWLRTYQSAITISGVGNHIAHNHIHDGPGTGILLTGNEHIIEYNDLHRLALETGDVGAFYMGRDWTERGNIIRYNYFHDLQGPGAHDVNAVYLDDWTSGTTVTGNIFINCARGVMIGGGRDNLIDNNLFIGCRPAVHVDSRGLGWAKYYFDGTDNTLFNRMEAVSYQKAPYAEKYPALLSLYADDPAIAKNNRLTRNISYLGRWVDLLDGLDLSVVASDHNIIGKPEKKYTHKKDHTVKDNPGIPNYSKGDFRAQAKALKYGFAPIPYHKIGLQQDHFRAAATPAITSK